MQMTVVASACLTALLLAAVANRSVSANVIDRDHRESQYPRTADAAAAASAVAEVAESRALDLESIFAGFAKSMISRTAGATSSQNQHCLNPGVKKRSAEGFCKMSSLTTLSSPCQFFKMALGLCDLPDILMLSLNLSNVVLMLVLKGLIWGASYMQGGKGRKEGPAQQDAMFTNTDVLLFLGYLVADESGQYDCLNRVACEQPSRAESYLRSAEMLWKTAKMLDGVIPLDGKYENMLTRLQEAIEDGRADGDCQAKYKCSEPGSNENINLI